MNHTLRFKPLMTFFVANLFLAVLFSNKTFAHQTPQVSTSHLGVVLVGESLNHVSPRADLSQMYTDTVADMAEEIASQLKLDGISFHTPNKPDRSSHLFQFLARPNKQFISPKKKALVNFGSDIEQKMLGLKKHQVSHLLIVLVDLASHPSRSRRDWAETSIKKSFALYWAAVRAGIQPILQLLPYSDHPTGMWAGRVLQKMASEQRAGLQSSQLGFFRVDAKTVYEFPIALEGNSDQKINWDFLRPPISKQALPPEKWDTLLMNELIQLSLQMTPGLSALMACDKLIAAE